MKPLSDTFKLLAIGELKAELPFGIDSFGGGVLTDLF